MYGGREWGSRKCFKEIHHLRLTFFEEKYGRPAPSRPSPRSATVNVLNCIICQRNLRENINYCAYCYVLFGFGIRSSSSSWYLFTRYNFVACDMITTSRRNELFRVNQTYNLLAIVVYDTKNVVGLWNMFQNPTAIVTRGNFISWKSYTIFLMTRAARVMKIARDNRKQKSYRVNRPLVDYKASKGCWFWSKFNFSLASLRINNIFELEDWAFSVKL